MDSGLSWKMHSFMVWRVHCLMPADGAREMGVMRAPKGFGWFRVAILRGVRNVC